MLSTILLFLFASCLAIIIAILIRAIPRLRVINIDLIPKERTRKVKERIILERFERASAAKAYMITAFVSVCLKFISRVGRRAVQKLYAIEQSYQKLKRSASEGQHAYDAETIQRHVAEAEALVHKSEFIPAEKIYIDIISHNPKNIDAYEGLGNLYYKNSQLNQARETLQFALRLSPNDASVHVSLAELELSVDNPKSAVAHLKKAVQKRPKNPKYLDYYIEASLKAGSLKDSRDGIRMLKAVNPENQKISDFEERFFKQKEMYLKKAGATNSDKTNSDPSQTK